MAGHCEQGCGAPRFGQLLQRSGLARQPVPGQGRDPVSRHHRTIRRPHPQPLQIRGPVQGLDQARTRHPGRCPTPGLHLGEPEPLRHGQRRPQPPRQHRVHRSGRRRETGVHPLRRGLADRANQPGQHRNPRQQHPVTPQPPHPMVEQRPRTLDVGPLPPIQELPQLRIRFGVLEHPEPVGVPDLPDMLIRRHRPVGVTLDARGVGDAQLGGHVLRHRPRHIQRVLQEPANEAHRGRLQHQPEPVVLTPAMTDQLPVDVIKDEEPLQISPRRHPIETPVPGDLRISQKIQRHAPRTVDLPTTPASGQGSNVAP